MFIAVAMIVENWEKLLESNLKNENPQQKNRYCSSLLQ